MEYLDRKYTEQVESKIAAVEILLGEHLIPSCRDAFQLSLDLLKQLWIGEQVALRTLPRVFSFFDVTHLQYLQV